MKINEYKIFQTKNPTKKKTGKKLKQKPMQVIFCQTNGALLKLLFKLHYFLILRNEYSFY